MTTQFFLRLQIYFHLAINYLDTLFWNTIKEKLSGLNMLNIKIKIKNQCAFIYLQTTNLYLINTIYLLSKLYGFASFVCHKNALLILAYICTNSRSRYGHIHIKKWSICFFHLYHIFNVCSNFNTHKELLPLLKYKLIIVFMQSIYHPFSHSGA